LQQRISELEATTEQLRQASVAQQANIERWQNAYKAQERRQHQHRVAEAESDEQATTDLFRCETCSSLWLLSAWSDLTCRVRRAVGKGCDVCNDDPLHRLWEVKTGAGFGAAAEVPRPASEPPSQPIEHIDSVAKVLSPAGGPVSHIDPARVAIDLLKDGPEAALAKALASEVREQACAGLDRVTPVPQFSWLNAIATGLDTAPKVARNGLAWCATEILGLPEVMATLLGEFASRTILEPFQFKLIARGIRMVGTVLEDPACTYDFVCKEIERLGANELADVLRGAIEEPTSVAGEPANATEVARPARTVDEIPRPAHDPLDGPNIGFW
jgi:hypothetical protein